MCFLNGGALKHTSVSYHLKTIIDEITVNNIPLDNNQQQDSRLKSIVHPSILGNSNLQANTSESSSAVIASEIQEPIPSTSTPAYRYI